MTPSPMFEMHQTGAPWAWTLARRQAVTLRAEGQPRWLRVDSGRVWVTARDGGAGAEDIWLDAGQSLALPAGSAWVLEAWPEAQVSLLQAAPGRFSRGACAGSSRRASGSAFRWPFRWSSWRALSVHAA